MRWLHDAHRGVPSSVVLAVDKARSADFSVHPSSCTSVKKTPLPPRRSSIARTAITGKRARIRRNAARQAKNLERAHGSPERREWMKRQPCVVCGRVPSDAAHITTGGGSRKADADQTVPMCRAHHDEYDGRKHAGGKLTFARTYPHLDLPALAAETDHRYTLEHAA